MNDINSVADTWVELYAYFSDAMSHHPAELQDSVAEGIGGTDFVAFARAVIAGTVVIEPVREDGVHWVWVGLRVADGVAPVAKVHSSRIFEVDEIEAELQQIIADHQRE